MNGWVLLIVAGLLETFWAIGLKFTDGFTRLWPSVWTAIGFAASMVLLSLAARSIPIGTAYLVWVGIGAVGTIFLEWFWLGEPLRLPRLFFAMLLLAAIVGLKMTSEPAGGDLATQASMEAAD